jgi:antitoxin HigA-1
MNMHNPPHPGLFIKATYLDPYKISIKFLADHLKISVSTIHRIINCKSAISPEMAYRLSAVLGRTPESWLAMQAQYDLWQTKQPKLKRIDFSSLEKAA